METIAKKRIFFLDNLKGFVILLVIMHHASMPYMINAISTWGIEDIRTNIFFDFFVSWDDNYIMTLMFFVSGFFALASLNKDSSWKFLKDKWFRVGWPWLTGIVVLGTITRVISHPDLLEVKPFFLFDVSYWFGHFSAQQYWYLNLLLWFYLVLFFLKKIAPSLLMRREKAEKPNIWFFVILIVINFASMYFINLSLPDYSWSTSFLFTAQWTRLLSYFLFFLCGALSWRNCWFTEGGYIPKWKPWLILGVILSIVYFIAFYLLMGTDLKFVEDIKASAATFVLIQNILRAVMGIVLTFMFISVFQRFADFTNKFWKELCATAFAIYWIQQPVVEVFSRLTQNIDVNCFVKFMVVSVMTFLVSFLISKYLLLRIPFFGKSKKLHIG